MRTHEEWLAFLEEQPVGTNYISTTEVMVKRTDGWYLCKTRFAINPVKPHVVASVCQSFTSEIAFS